MLPIALFAAAQMAAPSTKAPAPATWSTLPVLPIAMTPTELAPMSGFVADEVAAGRCAAATVAADGASEVSVPIVVRRLPDGRVDAIRPQAIGCPTVEQYVAGLLQRFVARPMPLTPPGVATWYRTGLTFRWPR